MAQLAPGVSAKSALGLVVALNSSRDNGIERLNTQPVLVGIFLILFVYCGTWMHATPLGVLGHAVAQLRSGVHCWPQPGGLMRIQNLLTLVALAAASALAGCSSSSTTNTFPAATVGGQANVGGGGAASVGGGGGTKSSGGTANNVSTGGTPANTGGANVGGNATGGRATGGAATGGANVGGNATGGKATGGANVGGNATGGTPPTTGGTPAATGGTPTTGTGGGTGTGTAPAGYYYTKDWNVTSVDWHGCVWTGIDSTVTGSTTTITPKDFTTVTEGGPYHVTGTVYNDYNAVALLGFNLNEAITGSTQCVYNAAAATQAGPPAITTNLSAYKGIAVNWSAAKAPPTSFRIQIQGVDGATNAAHRWCQTITDTQGPSFAPFTAFYPSCWSTTAPGTAFNPATDTIDAVVFLVPGTVAQTAPFDFTIVGFAPGNDKTAAPGPTAACGTTAGTLGSTTASQAASMQRAAISGTDCKKYVVFNNNWGQPTSTTQLINYTGNSFTVQSSTAATSGNGVPGSFPSVFIGANGDIAGGTYNTWADSGLPKQISAIGTANTSFAWSGGTSGGDYNATYDVWFASSPPTAGSYNDAPAGFIMVWLYKPGSRSPIGAVRRTATIAGHTWNVWVGPRGTTSTGATDANRPVVSYVAQDSPVASLSFDLKAFMNDAVTNGAADKSSGGTSTAFSSSWYLTDVFAGFEIWSGGNAAGLKDTFSCVIN